MRASTWIYDGQCGQATPTPPLGLLGLGQRSPSTEPVPGRKVPLMDAMATTASELALTDVGVLQVPNQEGDRIDDQLARALVVVEHVECVTSLVVHD